MSYRTLKCRMKLNHDEFSTLKELTHTAKNLTNSAIYNVRQEFFNSKKYLSYNENYKLLKTNENYKVLNSNMAQQIIKEVDGSFKSFFGLLNLKNKGKYSSKINIPHYLDKDSYATLIIGFVRVKENTIILPYSNMFKRNHKPIVLKIPKIIQDKKIKEVRIIPKYNARYFEVQYCYEVEEHELVLDSNKALAIDLGVNNLMTCVDSEGYSFIIDGKKIKSVNQYFNKVNSRLSSLKDRFNKEVKQTKKQIAICVKRNNRINDLISKSCIRIIKYCVEKNIGNIVLGYNEYFQRSCKLGKKNNQTFVNIPFGKIKEKLEYLSKENGIKLIIQEESYTSKASFFDKDEMPIYRKEEGEIEFSGKRIKRGIYETKEGKKINADLNGALNILRKSKVVSLETLYCSGGVFTPVRVRIA